MLRSVHAVRLLLAAAAMIASSIDATPAPISLPTVVSMMQTGATSMLIATATGMTLYTNSKDPPGVSTCTSTPEKKKAPICAQMWQPLEAVTGDSTIGSFTVITRDDGTLQWAYAGKPLYTYANDHVPLEAHGDGLQGIWHIARP
jgi:predicted lipoprotein with Yx(FWY)xxD motif